MLLLLFSSFVIININLRHQIVTSIKRERKQLKLQLMLKKTFLSSHESQQEPLMHLPFVVFFAPDEVEEVTLSSSVSALLLLQEPVSPPGACFPSELGLTAV